MLYREHVLLGARFGDGDGAVVERYACETGAEPAGTEPAGAAVADTEPAGAAPGADLRSAGVVLSDVSDMSMLLFSGPPATSFATTAFAGRVLEAGECSFQAVLTGDGSLVSVPLLARTGTSEYVVADLSARSDVLDGWLSFLSAVETEGVAPFASIECEDVSGAHVALVLAGAEAADVLGDYVRGGKAGLPGVGRIEQCMLDSIPCIVARPQVGELDAFVLLVPPVHAVSLWRSLLSFGEVAPVGRAALRSLARDELSWSRHLRSSDTIRLGHDDLSSAGLVRETCDFVGARGIAGLSTTAQGPNAAQGQNAAQGRRRPSAAEGRA